MSRTRSSLAWSASAIALVAAVALSPKLFPKRVEPVHAARPAKSPALSTVRPTGAEPAPSFVTIGKAVRDGLSISLRVGHVNPKRATGSAFREGDNVVIGLELSDATSGLPVTKARPAAWLVTDDGDGDDPRKTANLVKSLIEARYFTRARLDLNVYYVLTLNEDSVSVVDPLYGFGGMKLLALVPLGGKGYDWALAADRNRLFVTVPEVNEVVAVDTRDWTVSARVKTPPRPTRVALQPDGRSVWVACDGPKGAGNAARLARVDVESPAVVATAPLGTGPHDLAFSDDSRSLVVTNGRDGTATVVDTGRPERAVTLPTGRRPVSVAYSTLAGLAWIAHAGDGRVVAVDPVRARVVSEVATGLTLEHLRFTPDGRRALAVSPTEGRVVVLDASTGRPVQQGSVDGEPDRVAFSDAFAYVRRRTSPMLRAIPLEGLGFAGRSLPEIDIPMGSGPLGQFRLATPADVMVMAPGGSALLVVNTEDKSVHYYKEGMSAPMGSFRLRNGYPRAALAVDRSLQERRRPGFYETAVTLPEAAGYKLVAYLSSPRVLHTFRLRTEPDPTLARTPRAQALDVAFPDPPRRARAGETVALRFLVTDRVTKDPRPGLPDLRVQATLMPGTWSDWFAPEPQGGGWYEVRFRPVREGVYVLFFASASAGLEPPDTQRHVLQVAPPDAG